jgi:SAM-dependent methyltransferase
MEGEQFMAANESRSNVKPDRVMQFAFGFGPPLLIETGVRLGIFDLLDKGPRALNEISTATKAPERGLRIVLNALVGLEFLTRDAKDRYALTEEASAFLVSGRNSFLGGLFKHISTQLLPPWQQLTDVVRTGKPAKPVNQESTGAPFFAEFVADLYPLNYRPAQTLADTVLQPLGDRPVSVLDLAAGSGIWSIAIAQKSPKVTVTAVDWPTVLEVTRKTAAKFGLESRFRFVAGDLQKADFGTGHQIATLGHILHSEGEQRSRQLLKKTFAALAPGATIAIAEWLVNDDRKGPPPALTFAVNMLVNTEQGDTFSFNEIKRWLEEAGFVKARTLEVAGPSPLVLAEKPKG